ncbi:MAG: glycosyltransferase family 2 protein [candidate division KSB1 bacterium]|nr:glycosyltransferase family 2 protein [candidate division KSB1 bacterium]
MNQETRYPYGLSIILPAYNEEENIEVAINRCVAVLEQLRLPHEVIVINDGSTDRTAEICRACAEAHSCVRLIEFESNRGYGVALRTGFLHAHYGYVFYTDSDNQFDVSELKYLLPIIDSYDLVVGFRVYRYDPPVRLFLSWGYNLLIRLLFQIRLHDIDCSFKLFRREIFDHIQLESDDFFIDTEIVLKAKRLGYNINEVGVRHYPRTAGKTTVRPSDIPRTLRTLLRIWKKAGQLKPKAKPLPPKELPVPQAIPVWREK